MLGFLGGLSIVALILMRDRFRPMAFVIWALAVSIAWIHTHGTAYCGVINV